VHILYRDYLSGFSAPESDCAPDPFVWLGTLATGEVKKRSPKNISIARGYYDGPGGFEDVSKSIEAHLAAIESDAAAAIQKLLPTDPTKSADTPSEIWRFLAWQAARTPGWFELLQEWVNDPASGETTAMVEPPPEGIDLIKSRVRSHWLEDPQTGRRLEIQGREEFESLRALGWKWILRHEDRLEALHMQAWYFQVRHFPRL